MVLQALKAVCVCGGGEGVFVCVCAHISLKMSDDGSSFLNGGYFGWFYQCAGDKYKTFERVDRLCFLAID